MIDDDHADLPTHVMDDDDHLRLVLLCCHPALDRDAQVALTLRLVGGLTTPEIAAAFLVPEATLAQRIVRAKRKIRDAGIPLSIPADLDGRVDALLAVNPSYVFFREVPDDASGPVGSLGVPLTPERSIAVDPRAVPLGAPVFLATTEPNAPQPMRRLVFAQDTGSAIKGAVRADLYFGSGPAAGDRAGRMKQRGELWVLLPR